MSRFQPLLRLFNTNVDGNHKFMFGLSSVNGVGRRFSTISDLHVAKRAELDKLMTGGANPSQFKMSDYLHNRQKDYNDGRSTQVEMHRSFQRSNTSFLLCSGTALQSEVVRLNDEMFLVDVGLGTPRVCKQDELTGVPKNRVTRFENNVGFLDLVAGESLIKKKILERFFIDLIAGDSLMKERASARFNDMVGSTDVVAGEPLILLPRRFRQSRAWMELTKVWRTNAKVKGFIIGKIKGGYSVAIAGFIAFLPFRSFKSKRLSNDRFTIESINFKRNNIVVL